MTEYGCIACHTIPGVTRADATVGPPLTGWAKRASIAGEFPNTPENLIAWIQDPQAMNPGSIMPDVGVPDAVARDMSAYLYTLKWNPAEPPWRRNEKW
jgi:cytochrome c